MDVHVNPSAAACLKAAHAMLALSDEAGGEAWDYMQQEPHPYSCFLWVDRNEDTDTIVERWNELAVAQTPLILKRTEGDEPELPQYFVLDGKEISIPFEYEPGDAMIAVATLNQLVRDISELRLCVASSGSSECAFLCLPPRVWQQLESEYGTDAIKKRFHKLTIAFE